MVPQGSRIRDWSPGLGVGAVKKISDKALLARYLGFHPTAELYATFQDFNLYRMRVEAAHLVAGLEKFIGCRVIGCDRRGSTRRRGLPGRRRC